MATVKIWIHLVWTTKKRNPYLVKDIRNKVFTHIRENARAKNIYIDFISGHKDHVHALISLKANQSISKVSHLIKGESSYWINKNHLIKQKFSWQDEFYAASVAYSDIDRIRDYIKNQEEHHKEITFEEEYKKLLEEIGFNYEIILG